MDRRLRDYNDVFPPFSAPKTASLLTDQQIGLDFILFFNFNLFIACVL